MLRVDLLSSRFDQYTGGAKTVEIEAANIRELIEALDVRYPGLGECIDRHGAVAIDGTIYQDAWGQPLHPENEICLIPRIAGG